MQNFLPNFLFLQTIDILLIKLIVKQELCVQRGRNVVWDLVKNKYTKTGVVERIVSLSTENLLQDFLFFESIRIKTDC